jgi:hypothetical protein
MHFTNIIGLLFAMNISLRKKNIDASFDFNGINFEKPI